MIGVLSKAPIWAKSALMVGVERGSELEELGSELEELGSELEELGIELEELGIELEEEFSVRSTQAVRDRAKMPARKIAANFFILTSFAENRKLKWILAKSVACGFTSIVPRIPPQGLVKL